MGVSIGLKSVVGSGGGFPSTPPAGRQTVVNLTGSNLQSGNIARQNDLNLEPGWYEIEIAGCGGGNGQFPGAPGGYANFTLLVPLASTANLSVGTPGGNASVSNVPDSGGFQDAWQSLGGNGGKNDNVINDTKPKSTYNIDSSASHKGSRFGGGDGSVTSGTNVYTTTGGGGSTPSCGGIGSSGSGGAGSGGGIGGDSLNVEMYQSSGVPIFASTFGDIPTPTGNGGGAGGGRYIRSISTNGGGGGGGGSSSIVIPELELIMICGGGGGGGTVNDAIPGHFNLKPDSGNANNPAGAGYIIIKRCI